MPNSTDRLPRAREHWKMRTVTLKVRVFPIGTPFRDVLIESVYSSGRKAGDVAADVGMSLANMSRKLAERPSDPVKFPATCLPALIHATGDPSPVYWLIQHCLTPAARESRPSTARIRAALVELLESLDGHEVPGGDPCPTT